MHPSGQETFRVGFVLFVALLILVGAVVLIGSETLESGERIRYQAYFDDVGGLGEGAPVYLGGKGVGRVVSVDFSEAGAPGPIVVSVAINADARARIVADWMMKIETEGLLGEKLISIEPGGGASAPLPEGGTIPSQPLPLLSGMVARGELIVDEATGLMTSLRGVLDKIEAGEGTLARLVNDEELHDQLRDTLVEVRELARELRASAGNLEGTVVEATDRLSRRADQVLDDFRIAFERLSAEAVTALTDVRELTREIRSGDGTLTRLITDDGLYTRLEAAVDRVANAAERLGVILDDVAEGRGTLGGLVRDRTVLTALEDIVQGVRESSLVVGAIQRAERTGRSRRLERALGGEPAGVEPGPDGDSP